MGNDGLPEPGLGNSSTGLAAKARSVDPFVVVGCVGGMGAIVGATVVANGLLDSDWSLVGSGLFDRDSDTGFLGGLLALVFIAVLGIVPLAVATAILAWKHRRAASAATAATFDRHIHLADGHGRTGAGHVSP